MKKATAVKAMEGYKIWVKFADGVEGTADLSDLAGRGVFSAWNDYRAFENVHIGSGGEIVWSQDLDVCADALYLEITGKAPEDLFPSLKSEATYA